MSIYTSAQVLPYVYKLIHKFTKQFYYGYREANKVPSYLDLGIIYFSSSDIIRDMGFANFEYEIIAEFYLGEDAYDFENRRIEAEFNDPLCLNQVFSKDGKLRFRKIGPDSVETRKKKSDSAHKRPPVTAETRAKHSKNKKNRIVTLETRAKLSANQSANVGKPQMRGVWIISNFEKEPFIVIKIQEWCSANNISYYTITKFANLQGAYYTGIVANYIKKCDMIKFGITI